MSVAAHSSRTLKIDGTSTSFTNEATTKVTANTVYRITDATKRVIDPDVAVVVEVDADGAGAGAYAVAGATTYTINFLAGEITFASDQGSSALVRVSGSYLPMLTVAECRELSYSVKRASLDKTNYGSGGYTEKTVGLADVTGSFATFKLPEYDHDPGGSTHKLVTRFFAGTRVMIEDRFDATHCFRAWVYMEGIGVSGDKAALLESGVEFTGAARTGTGRTDDAAFGWGI